MSAREEKARGYFAKSYNCAQSVFGAFSEDWGIDSAMALRLASGLGGGLRHGEVCGAVSGATLAIGLKCGLYIEGDLAQKMYCNQKTIEFIEKFKEANGTILCRELLGADIHHPDDLNTPEIKAQTKIECPEFIAAAVRILEDMEFDGK